MVNFRKVGILSAAFLIAQIILTKVVYPIFGTGTEVIQGFAIKPMTGIGGTNIGDTILGYFSGAIPFDFSNIQVLLAMFIGTFLLVLVGFWLYEQKYVKLWPGKNLYQRLVLILAYGHVVLYLILLALKSNVPGITGNLLIRLAINLVLVSILVAASAKYLKWPKV